MSEVRLIKNYSSVIANNDDDGLKGKICVAPPSNISEEDVGGSTWTLRCECTVRTKHTQFGKMSRKKERGSKELKHYRTY